MVIRFRLVVALTGGSSTHGNSSEALSLMSGTIGLLVNLSGLASFDLPTCSLCVSIVLTCMLDGEPT